MSKLTKFCGYALCAMVVFTSATFADAAPKHRNRNEGARWQKEHGQHWDKPSKPQHGRPENNWDWEKSASRPDNGQRWNNSGGANWRDNSKGKSDNGKNWGNSARKPAFENRSNNGKRKNSEAEFGYSSESSKGRLDRDMSRNERGKRYNRGRK